jgi:ketosteroid isomerase-like protein
MGTATLRISEESAIRKLIDGQVEAIRAKDIEKATAFLAPDVVSFDVIDPLTYSGKDAVKQRLTQWFEQFQGNTLGFEAADLKISADENVAFCRSLNKVKGIMKNGEPLEMYWRATICFEKIGGQWLATHEHSSVPFNMETGKASLDLKPE